jgi:ABC-type Zn2+ transport system substrate-binding protein/surface adhesin
MKLQQFVFLANRSFPIGGLTVIKGTSAKTALIDPLGSSIEDGPELYITLLKNMADSFKSCFNT